MCQVGSAPQDYYAEIHIVSADTIGSPQEGRSALAQPLKRDEVTPHTATLEVNGC